MRIIRNLVSARFSCDNMIVFLFSLCLAGVLGAEYTLPGVCPNVKVQENLDYTRVCMIEFFFLNE